ncbi:dehydrodolichyl diphosphate synthase complex subunit DHDDS-like [Atheta coriaria]|uniref:dehydrodolichyl diphosphate synthase complex subunit DHDDS-like n=1 Tax=Dalotia coriaria TaxID=877792 RepID=UPI0031F4658A
MSWLLQNTLSWYHKFCIRVLKSGPIPKHIAIIMDGNRRYAKKETLPTTMGHIKGFEKLTETLVWCRELGIKEVTVYAFSIENFNRSNEEVDALFALACEKFEKLLGEVNDLHAKGICIRLIGNLDLIPDRLKGHIAKSVLLTRNNTDAFLNIAFAYTSQDEMTNSLQMIKEGIARKEIFTEDVNEALIGRCMYSGRSSRPEVLIRTSGEVRFSDFLLWQTWNTNVMFRKVLWPDFSIWDLLACVFLYQENLNHQISIGKLLRCDDFDNIRDNRVEEFVSRVEDTRMQQLQVYASS